MGKAVLWYSLLFLGVSAVLFVWILLDRYGIIQEGVPGGKLRVTLLLGFMWLISGCLFFWARFVVWLDARVEGIVEHKISALRNSHSSSNLN